MRSMVLPRTVITTTSLAVVSALSEPEVEDAKMRLSESFQQDYDLLTGKERFGFRRVKG